MSKLRLAGIICITAIVIGAIVATAVVTGLGVTAIGVIDTASVMSGIATIAHIATKEDREPEDKKKK